MLSAARQSTCQQRQPDDAAEHFAMAAQAFRRAGADESSQKALQRLENVRCERPCWFCSRVVRGLGDNLVELPTIHSDSFARMAKEDRERGEAWSGEGTIFACAACASAVDEIAVKRADEVREELATAVSKLNGELRSLESRLRQVESMSHHHSGGSR